MRLANRNDRTIIIRLGGVDVIELDDGWTDPRVLVERIRLRRRTERRLERLAKARRCSVCRQSGHNAKTCAARRAA